MIGHRHLCPDCRRLVRCIGFDCEDAGTWRCGCVGGARVRRVRPIAADLVRHYARRANGSVRG